MINKYDITGIVLAGGKSSRMGSDKASMMLEGKPFIRHVIDAMKPLVKEIIIVSNHEDHSGFGFQQVKDIIAEAGPLSGLCSGLKYSKSRYNLVLSCDVPFIQTRTLELLTKADLKSFDVTQLATKSRAMPLIALYEKDCLETCLNLLQSGERRLTKAIELLNCQTITLGNDQSRQIRNINTPEELKLALHDY